MAGRLLACEYVQNLQGTPMEKGLNFLKTYRVKNLLIHLFKRHLPIEIPPFLFPSLRLSPTSSKYLLNPPASLDSTLQKASECLRLSLACETFKDRKPLKPGKKTQASPSTHTKPWALSFRFFPNDLQAFYDIPGTHLSPALLTRS